MRRYFKIKPDAISVLSNNHSIVKRATEAARAFARVFKAKTNYGNLFLLFIKEKVTKVIVNFNYLSLKRVSTTAQTSISLRNYPFNVFNENPRYFILKPHQRILQV